MIHRPGNSHLSWGDFSNTGGNPSPTKTSNHGVVSDIHGRIPSNSGDESKHLERLHALFRDYLELYAVYTHYMVHLHNALPGMNTTK